MPQGYLIDPRYGYIKAELFEHKTDSYYNTQEEQLKELKLEECNVEETFTKDINRQLCVKFEQRRVDNTYDSETPLTLFGSSSLGIDYSYLKLSIVRCESTMLQKLRGYED